MKYKVVLYPSDQGYAVCAPALPGCWSQGATREDALTNIRDAIREYLDVVDEETKEGEVQEVEVS